MVYGLWFPIYGRQNKTRKKVCWLQIIAGIISHMRVIPMLSDYTSIESLVSVWFYFTFIFIIKFVLMVFNMKFVSDAL